MSRSRKGATAKINEGAINSRIGELEDLFAKQLNDFKNEIVNLKRSDNTARSPQVLDDLEIRFNIFEESTKKSIEEFKMQVSEIANGFKELNQQFDNSTQISYKSSLLIYGISESEKGDLTSVVITLINSQLNMSLQKTDVYDCYRYGAKSGDKFRPVVIEFVHAWVRNDVFYKKSSFKGTNYVFSERLTTQRYQVYREARAKLKNDCWTKNGKIAFIWKNKKYLVTNNTQFNTIIGQK